MKGVSALYSLTFLTIFKLRYINIFLGAQFKKMEKLEPRNVDPKWAITKKKI